MKTPCGGDKKNVSFLHFVFPSVWELPVAVTSYSHIELSLTGWWIGTLRTRWEMDSYTVNSREEFL